MTNCTSKIMKFQGVKGRKVQAFFSGQTITSDAGALLLKDADLASKLTHRLSRCFTDTRRKASCNHSITTMLRQRVYGLALGYEDLNDHNLLRHDPALQTVIGQDESMASASTLCRFENNVDAKTLWKMSAVLIDLFIESHKSPPPEIVLDFDATNDAVHGNQEGRFFHGYYDHYCFLPLYVFCGSHLLAAYLRPSNIDAAKHAHGIAGLLVKRLRQAWPHTRIILRADSGFCRWKMLRWCDKQKVDYIIGIGQNSRLLKANHNILDEVKQLFLQIGTKQKRFTEVIYAAKSWDKARRIITKAEHLDQGSNPRFVVTSLDTEPEELYQRYCARGEMEMPRVVMSMDSAEWCWTIDKRKALYLTGLKSFIGPYRTYIWWAERDSNPRPLAPEANALSI